MSTFSDLINFQRKCAGLPQNYSEPVVEETLTEGKKKIQVVTSREEETVEEEIVDNKNEALTLVRKALQSGLNVSITFIDEEVTY